MIPVVIIAAKNKTTTAAAISFFENRVAGITGRAGVRKGVLAPETMSFRAPHVVQNASVPVMAAPHLSQNLLIECSGCTTLARSR